MSNPNDYRDLAQDWPIDQHHGWDGIWTEVFVPGLAIIAFVLGVFLLALASI